jgi:hypothetical protein
MASAVDIANLALSHLGDTATVASLVPPEGSAQAEHCATFYPISRDVLLEMHTWSFALRKIALAQVANSWGQWQYAYALPSDCMTAISVLSSEATADYNGSFNVFGQFPSDFPDCGVANTVNSTAYTPQPFAVEVDSTGAKVLYTNQESALLRYKAMVTDTNQFSQLFIMTLSWHLASMLAGPVIKGDQGAAEAKRCQEMMAVYLGQARSMDATQRNIHVEQVVPFISGR